MSKNVIKNALANMSGRKKYIFTLNLSSARIKKRTRLWVENDGKCHYCQCDTVLPHIHASNPNIAPKGSIATLDHIITQVEGGTDSLRNLVLACANCNHKRGEMLYEQFMYLCTTPGAWEEYRKQQAREKALRDEERRKESMKRHKLHVEKQQAEAAERKRIRESLKTDAQKQTEKLHKMFGCDGNKLLRSWVWRANVILDKPFRMNKNENCHTV